MKADFVINGNNMSFGSVSTGSLVPRDVLRAIVPVAEQLSLHVPMNVREGRAWLATAVDWQSYVWDDIPEVQDAQDEELGHLWMDAGHRLMSEISTYLDFLAPEGVYFGSHIGDGADLGWWPIDEE